MKSIRLAAIVAFIAWLVQICIGGYICFALREPMLRGAVFYLPGVLFSYAVLFLPFTGLAAAWGLWKRTCWSLRAALGAMIWYCTGAVYSALLLSGLFDPRGFSRLMRLTWVDVGGDFNPFRFDEAEPLLAICNITGLAGVFALVFFLPVILTPSRRRFLRENNPTEDGALPNELRSAEIR